MNKKLYYLTKFYYTLGSICLSIGLYWFHTRLTMKALELDEQNGYVIWKTNKL